MPKDRDWNWIERFFGKVSAKHQRRVSISIFILLYCFFILFSVKLVRYNLDFHGHIVAISSCILVALQTSGINHFIKKIKNLFEVRIKAVENIGVLYDQISTQFVNSWKKYFIIFSVIAPFILIRANDLINGRIIFFYQVETTLWAMLFDIYNQLVKYFILYLLAVNLWIMFNISWMLNEVLNESYYRSIKINIFNFGFNGVSPIRDVILEFIIYYFFIIILSILTFLTPKGFILYDSLCLMILLVIGVIFFIHGWYTIHKIRLRRIKEKVNDISELIDKRSQLLMDTISSDEIDEKKIKWISGSIETLYEQRKRILDTKNNTYDPIGILTFMGGFISSLVTFISKLYANDTMHGLIKYILYYIKLYI